MEFGDPPMARRMLAAPSVLPPCCLRGTRQGLPCTSAEEPRTPRLSVQGVPAACPIGWSAAGTHGQSWIARYTGSPAYGLADPQRKQAF